MFGELSSASIHPFPMSTSSTTPLCLRTVLFGHPDKVFTIISDRCREDTTYQDLFDLTMAVHKLACCSQWQHALGEQHHIRVWLNVSRHHTHDRAELAKDCYTTCRLNETFSRTSVQHDDTSTVQLVFAYEGIDGLYSMFRKGDTTKLVAGKLHGPELDTPSDLVDEEIFSGLSLRIQEEEANDVVTVINCLSHSPKRKASDDNLSVISNSSDSSSSSSSKRVKLEPVRRVCGSVYISQPGDKKRLPVVGHFHHFLTDPGILFVDKTESLSVLKECFENRIPTVFRRPHGFGLKTFTSMVTSRYDWNWDIERDAFSALDIGMSTGEFHDAEHESFILRLDFSDKRIDKQNLSDSLTEYIRGQISRLFHLYGPFPFSTECHDNPNCPTPPGFLISWFADHLHEQDNHFPFLLIENYTELTKFDISEEYGVMTHFYRSVYSNAPLFSGILLTAYMDGPQKHCEEQPYDLTRKAFDLTNHRSLQEACGFTFSEVKDLLLATKDITRPGAIDFWEELKKRGISPCSFIDTETCGPMFLYVPEEVTSEPVYSVKDILAILRDRVISTSSTSFQT